MNRCFIQLWERSEKNFGLRPDGCSLHIDLWEREKYLIELYSRREKLAIVPVEYDRPLGDPLECFITDVLWEKLKERGFLRLFENEKNNLINMEDIIIKDGYQ